MTLSINLLEYLCGMATGKNRVESKQRGRERKREQRINGVSDGVLDRNGNGMGWKWSLVKRDT
jgi:hypothetical protein